MNASLGKKRRFAVIGGGISGLSVARMLNERGACVTVFETEATPGGLVRCERVEGVLYHCVGGHVFNSKNPEILEWFWRVVDADNFTLATRNAVVLLENGAKVDYPIENHLCQLPENMRSAVLDDILHIARTGYPDDDNFEDFLKHRFGETLYREYFAPYNYKIWRRKLSDIPLAWLTGKLPMPSVKQILEANISKMKEMQMVHSTFHYPKEKGSQYIADSLAKTLDIRYNSPVERICRLEDCWEVKGERFDAVIFCGNVKHIPGILEGVPVELDRLNQLEAHGTTSVLCEIDENPYSWVYMPSTIHESHRVICTGNFARSNSPEGMATATVEFTLKLSKNEILEQLKRIPFNPRYITHKYTPYTYPIQTEYTADIIADTKTQLSPYRFYLLGRFAEWEYYNMDAAMEAAMKLVNKVF